MDEMNAFERSWSSRTGSRWRSQNVT